MKKSCSEGPPPLLVLQPLKNTHVFVCVFSKEACQTNKQKISIVYYKLKKGNTV